MNKHRIILLLCALAAVSACGCTPKKPAEEPEVPFERYQKDLVMQSTIMGGTKIPYSILLPENYDKDKDKSYPVVYMLHGHGDNHNSWNGNYLHANNKIKNLEKNGLTEMIYVFPEGFTTYYCNYYTGKYNYMDMFVDDLIPFIDSTYRTIPDRNHRALTGYSMGGFGAMVLAEKHPETFICSAPLSMSFRTDWQYMAETQSGWDQQWGKIFGGTGKPGEERLTDYYKQHCPFYQFTPENEETLSQVKWFFICGDNEENLLFANDTLHIQLRDNAYDHEYRVVDGGHSSSVWMPALDEILPWFDHYMNGASAWPACAKPYYTKQEVNFREDGSACTKAYTGEEEGLGVYFFHDGLSEQVLKDAMSVMYSVNTKYLAVYLPCDLTQKTVAQWIEYYEALYPQKDRVAVSFEGTGATIMASQASFNTMMFINTVLGTDITADPSKKYYFACTDESACYADFGQLYRICKHGGIEFEYRVINYTGEPEDILVCASQLKSYIPYF